MGIQKSTGFLAVLVLALAVTSIGLLIALLLAKQESPGIEPMTNGEQQKSDIPLGSPTVSKDWDDDIQSSAPKGTGQVTEETNELSTTSKLPLDVDDLNFDKSQEEDTTLTKNISDLPWEKDVRLPRTVVPIHYDLYLFPDLTEGLFAGKVDILLSSQEPRDFFLVHSKYLEIDESRLFMWKSSSHRAEMELKPLLRSDKNEFLVLSTPETAPPGNFTISISFRGNLTRGNTGFYKSLYTNSRGQRIPIATSKFQPTYARRAFPCLDEPSFKSTFSVTLVRPSEGGYIALSNMPVEKENQNSPSIGFTEVKFEKSMPMVTYLACFIVCDFEYEEKRTEIHQTLFRVYATPNQKERVRYALEIGANITDFFEDYFEVAYPLPKQDMIAIPDFVSGAMEHWGLITYRETNLLFDSRESSSTNQQRVAVVISHELAHQWFGNLVTLSWWDDLWLNEGFASFMEYKGVANYHSDWDMDSQFLTEDLQKVMDLDATINSHPIIQPVEHPDQITEIFDTISYSKGAAVLRMLEHFMGPEEFRIGVKRFLERFKYGNAVTNNLWRELEGVSSMGLDITNIMDTWTRQMGYPVINVERVKPNIIRLRQDRYLLNPELRNTSSPSPYAYKWEIPITYISCNDHKTISQKWLHRNDEHIELTFPSGTEWVKFNVGQYGYYRVNYPADEWLRFADLMMHDHQVFSTTDRGSLINDAFSLGESGHLDYSIPLFMTKYLKREKDLVPWRSALDKIKFLEKLLKNSNQYSSLRKYITDLVDGHYERLGWRDEGSHTDRLTRIELLSLACRNGHLHCLNQAGDLFLAWIKDKSAYIPPNLREITYRFGMMAKGDESSWTIMLDRFQAEDNAQEKNKLLYGLAWINQPWILEQFLRLAKNESIIRRQDFFTCLSYINKNPIGNPIIWKFIREEWPYLVDRFSLNDRTLGRLPKSVTSDFSSEFQLLETKDFFARYPDAGAGSRARKQALENIENNIKWLQKHQETIEIWLKTNVISS